MNKTPKKHPFKEFVNYSLSERDKKDIKKFWEKEAPIEALMSSLVEDGFSVTFSWDHRSDCVLCVVSDKYSKYESAGYSISQRHTFPELAFAAVAWLVLVKFPQGTWVNPETAQDEFSW